MDPPGILPDTDYIKPVKYQWRSMRGFPQTVSLRIRCVSHNSCERIKKHMQKDSPPDVANVQLAFAFDKPATRVVPVCFDGNHIQHTPTFSLISERLTGYEAVYVQHADYYAFVHELIIQTIEGATGTDEFVDDEQIQRQTAMLCSKYRRNVTSTGVFTEDMWKATYWTDERERPDQKARHLQELFSNGMKWLQSQKTMRGDNVTGEMGAFGHSQSVMQAFAELRSGESGVQWDGEKIIVKPILLYCVYISKLDERKVCNVTVQLSKVYADYVVNAPVIPVTSPTSTSRTSATAIALPSPTTGSHIVSVIPSLAENECGGWIKVTNLASGFLRSPTSNSSMDYPNHAFCTCLVTGPPGKQLKFTEESSHPFAIAESCDYDKLVIGNTEYCSDSPFSTTTVPSSTTMVTFRTDHSGVGRGFFIKVEAV